MFKKLNARLVFLLILLIIYNFFFWKEKLGLNFLIFSVLVAVSVISLNPGSLKSTKVILMLIAVTYTGTMVIINNSVFSKLALFISLMLLTGYAHQPQLRSLFASFGTYVVSNLMIPAVVLEGIIKGKDRSRVFRFIFKIIKLGVIPVIVFLIFYLLYEFASVKFDFYSGIVIQEIGEFLYKIFIDYPFIRFMFIFMGFVLLIGVLYNSKITFFKDLDIKFRERLLRDKFKKLVWLHADKKHIPLNRRINIFSTKINSLLTEQKIGIILLALVNLLTLSFNIIDIKFLWLNFNPTEVTGFKLYVHEGAYTLIFSIVLSMLIIMYYFRGNINFYKRNYTIKILAYIWMAQNAFMTISVVLRNYYYISYTQTITYKRIGLMIYLLLTFIGLVTMILKIAQKRTGYNIFKSNAWAVFIVLMMMCSFNWDKNIAEHNLSASNPYDADIAYLLELSDDVLPVLFEKNELMNRSFLIPRSTKGKPVIAREYFDKRLEKFMKEQNSYTWLSWNLSDKTVIDYFHK